MQKIELDYQHNVRDLGGLVAHNGLKVKKGRLFRSGFLGKVSPSDIVKINALHLTDIIDFRGVVEFEKRPDYKFDGVTYHNFPPLVENIREEEKNLSDANLLWFVDDSVGGFRHMYQMYQTMLTTEVGLEAYSNFFKVLLNEDRKVLFHCSQGKDRAGLAAFLLEIALGVPEEEAKIDYLLTNEAMDLKIEELLKIEKKKEHYNERYHQSLIDVFSAKEEYLKTTIDSLNEQFGSVLNYIKKALNVDVDRLRSLYLE